MNDPGRNNHNFELSVDLDKSLSPSLTQTDSLLNGAITHSLKCCLNMTRSTESNISEIASHNHNDVTCDVTASSNIC